MVGAHEDSGAGFSRPAGFPLAVELWEEIRKKGCIPPISGPTNSIEVSITTSSSANKADGEALTPEAVDFEDFMRFFDVEPLPRPKGQRYLERNSRSGMVPVA